VRSALIAAANAYATVLTPSQRAGWADFANTNPLPNKVGLLQKLAAIGMFNKVNIPIINGFGSGAIVADSPGATPLLGTMSPGPTMGLATGTVTVDLLGPAAFAIGDLIFAFITRPNSPGRVATHQGYTMLFANALTAIPTIPGEYITTIADPYAGSRIADSPAIVRTFWIRGGNISPDLKTTVITA
jgi:hypothetical protein